MFNKLQLILSPLIFASCVSMSTIKIQVLEPASDPVTPAMVSAVLLNRMILENEQNSGNPDTLSPGSEIRESFNRATTEILFSLADILNESPGIDFLDDSKLLEIKTDDFVLLPDLLESNFVMFICDSLEADGIISLESYYVEYTDSIVSKQGVTETGWQNYYKGNAELHISAMWRTYIKTDGGLIDEYLILDTLQWVHAAFTINEVSDNLPSTDEILMEAAYFTALTYARRISPYWLENERYYFSRGNYNLRVASQFLENDQLDNAERIYVDLLTGRNNTIIAAACFNMALIYEFRGDFRQALVWARKSYQLKRNRVANDYIAILEERHAKSGELDKQLGIEK